jgi:hypothetical protein
MWRESVFDLAGRLTRYQTSGGKPVRLHYCPEGNAFSISNKAGTMRYEIDETDLAVTVVFEEI